MKGLELVQSRVQPLQSFISKSGKEELLAKVMVDFHGEYLKLWTVIAKFFLSLSSNLVGIHQLLCSLSLIQIIGCTW